MNNFFVTSEFMLHYWLVINKMMSLKRHGFFVQKACRQWAEGNHICSVIPLYPVSVISSILNARFFFIYEWMYLNRRITLGTIESAWPKISLNFSLMQKDLHDMGAFMDWIVTWKCIHDLRRNVGAAFFLYLFVCFSFSFLLKVLSCEKEGKKPNVFSQKSSAS